MVYCYINMPYVYIYIYMDIAIFIYVWITVVTLHYDISFLRYTIRYPCYLYGIRHTLSLLRLAELYHIIDHYTGLYYRYYTGYCYTGFYYTGLYYRYY